MDNPFHSTVQQRTDAVMQASVYQAIVFRARSADAIHEMLLRLWGDRRIPLTRDAVAQAIRQLCARGLVVDAGGLRPITAAKRLTVDYDRGIAEPERTLAA